MKRQLHLLIRAMNDKREKNAALYPELSSNLGCSHKI